MSDFLAVLERWEPIIGLEVHAQLSTQTKMFCGCRNSYGAPPNSHTCPTCLGLPGALPVANEQAVDFALRLGLAVGSKNHTAFTLRNEKIIFTRSHQRLSNIAIRRTSLCWWPGDYSLGKRDKRYSLNPYSYGGGCRQIHPC